MADKNNARCSICDSPYHVCLSCNDHIRLTPWKIHTDTAEHYKVYQVIHGFSTGVYSKSEAKNKFNNIDLSDIDTFRPHIKKIIEDILMEESAVDIMECETINRVDATSVDDSSVKIVDKTIMSYRKNKKRR